MTSIQSLLAFFQAIHPLSTAAQQALMDHFTVVNVNKKNLLLRAGDTAHSYQFVLKGLLRSYYVHEGKEITTRFMTQGHIVTSVISFFDRRPGHENIEVLTNAQVAVLRHEAALALFNTHLELNFIARVLLERFFVKNERFVQLLRLKTAADRIAAFNTLYPGLVNTVPDDYIASYLNLSRETFCREKRNLITCNTHKHVLV